MFVLLVTVGVIGLAWWTIGNPQRSAEKACRNEITDTFAGNVQSLVDHPSPAQHFMGPVPPGDLLSYHPGRGKLFMVTGTIDVNHGNNMWVKGIRYTCYASVTVRNSVDASVDIDMKQLLGGSGR